MADEKKDPKDWTSDDVKVAAGFFLAGVGKLIGDSGLKDVPGGKTVVLHTLMGCAAYFAELESISRHDFIDTAKQTYDKLLEMRQTPPATS